MKPWVKDVYAYLRDNPEGYWFKRKLYGWGWTPVTREGWLVTLGILLAILLNAFRYKIMGYSDRAMFPQLFVPTVLLVGVLLWVCVKKGETPRWQWGEELTKYKK